MKSITLGVKLYFQSYLNLSTGDFRENWGVHFRKWHILIVAPEKVYTLGISKAPQHLTNIRR